MKLPVRGLYAIADTATIRGDVVVAVAAAIDGGAAVIQYRDKTNDGARRLREAEQLVEACHRNGATLIVNDDVELAAAAGADGVHLGADDMDIAEARSRLPGGAIIGVSCYDSLARAKEAARNGADYVAFGSFYPSPTKPGAVRAPVALLSEARRQLSVPIVAIGGITPANAPTLVDAGASFLAVISGVFGSSDIERAARNYARCFGHSGSRLSG
ncbi:MAG TPA: thiamine phosphate synthase [Gammaproteobacteria bacterium]|nr:thiamine phosphate synthase [Gammaproteobacteria bacterium]